MADVIQYDVVLVTEINKVTETQKFAINRTLQILMLT